MRQANSCVMLSGTKNGECLKGKMLKSTVTTAEKKGTGRGEKIMTRSFQPSFPLLHRYA